MNDNKTNLPAAPEDLEGEALLEWGRVAAELHEAGRLQSADRAMLTLWCITFQTLKQVTPHVQRFGPIVPAANKVIGQSPWYKVQRECVIVLVKLAEQMGLTSRSRNYDANTDSTLKPLEEF